MQSYIQNLMNDHAMDHEKVWIVDDNARSLRSSDPFRRMAAKANHQSPDETDSDDNDRRAQMRARGPQRSDSAIPSGVERSDRRCWTSRLRRSVGSEYKAPRTTAAIGPLQRKWSDNRDSTLCCPVRRDSHDIISVDLNALEFDSSEFNSGEFSMDSIMEDREFER
ncbi:unnamed protein product [Cylindrotheca closterium]|uniref:Uncharacterized protein n=1 Tax=Cylindrotheca closterium TaxID=2856 RepID=A0AAD2CRQ7_9STRA|nr:unnamed protein product [Cylindrotheca closterium]